ncbi:MAG: peptidoglycan DD-metalloendopeptidase family protein [Flavobacteriales bacterium]|nr:peptidoglycan DD-metalloendopeptidase family protein [Flavobacteriales bacterium]
MTKHYALRPCILFLSAALSVFVQAQTGESLPIVDQRTDPSSPRQAPPGFMVKVDAEHGECMDEATRQQVWQEISTNIARLREEDPNAVAVERGTHPLFIWPTRAAASFTGYGFEIINNFVDHNPAFNNNLTDWNCGTRTYDWTSGNHMGTDIVLWPYAWRRMQEGVMEVVAAAAGTIVDKRDGFNDLQCVNAGNPNWNGIVLSHADGSTTWYLHFKSGSLTTKAVGESVAEGEYLGSAGSSGSSTIPHLHFEVHDNAGNYIDPFAGACNTFNGTDTWWAAQQAYKVPRINHISTHYASHEFYQCPVPETTYEQSNFMSGDSLIMRIYYRDLDNNALTNLLIRDAQGNVDASWNFNSPWLFGSGTWAWWYWLIDNTWATGSYTFEATFNGATYVRPFTIGMPIGVEENATPLFSVAPNPANETLHLSGLPSGNLRLSLLDATGRAVLTEQPNSTVHDLDISGLSVGAYQVKVEVDGRASTQRVMIAR